MPTPTTTRSQDPSNGQSDDQTASWGLGKHQSLGRGGEGITVEAMYEKRHVKVTAVDRVKRGVIFVNSGDIVYRDEEEDVTCKVSEKSGEF